MAADDVSDLLEGENLSLLSPNEFPEYVEKCGEAYKVMKTTIIPLHQSLWHGGRTKSLVMKVGLFNIPVGCFSLLQQQFSPDI